MHSAVDNTADAEVGFAQTKSRTNTVRATHPADITLLIIFHVHDFLLSHCLLENYALGINGVITSEVIVQKHDTPPYVQNICFVIER